MDSAAKTSLQQAIAHHQAGRLEQAAALYRELLAHDPKHIDALNLLGVLERQLGHFEAALLWIDQAIHLKGSIPDFHFNRAEALRAMGRYQEAAVSYAQVIALRNSDLEAHHALGICLDRLGVASEAIESLRRALQLKPAFGAAAADLSSLLLRQGKTQEAAEVCRNALRVNRKQADCQFQLGAALAKLNHHQEAVVAYRAAAVLRPRWAEARINLAASLARLARFPEAAEEARKAAGLKPNSAEALLNLGAAVEKLGQSAEAVDCYRRAIALKPEYAEAYNNLGLVLAKQGKLTEGTHAFSRAIKLKPTYAEAHSNMGNALKAQGRLEEAMVAHRKAIELEPSFAAAHSNLLFTLNYCPEIDPQSIFEEHLRWGRRQSGQASPAAMAVDHQAERRLRVGYVSPDFREHSVSFFFEPLLSAHDRNAFEITCYSDVPQGDAVTQRLKSSADRWRTIAGLPDEQVAQMIRQDQIDLLVDLAGHTGGNRLPLFARQAAPVQVSYLGYPNTTGLSQMQYRVTDALADPPGISDTLHSEELVRLPGCFVCYQPPAEAPAVSPLPADTIGYVTFGSFNQLAKVNGPLVKLWSQVLKAAPGSRLVLKTKSLADAGARAWVSHAFAACGIEPARLKLVGPEGTVAKHLARYAYVDIALDTFPYHGATTTCEALWMGVPVVTLAGETHVSRVGVSLLTSIGLSERVATSPERYVGIAAELAAELPRLRDLRSGLRQRMEASSLMNAKVLVQGLESAYQSLWRRYCSAVLA